MGDIKKMSENETKTKWYHKVFNFVNPLFSEDGESLSLGRIAFWIVLATAIPIWQTCSKDIQLYHFYTLAVLLGYNCYSKLTNPKFITFIKTIKGTDKE